MVVSDVLRSSFVSSNNIINNNNNNTTLQQQQDDLKIVQRLRDNQDRVRQTRRWHDAAVRKSQRQAVLVAMLFVAILVGVCSIVGSILGGNENLALLVTTTTNSNNHIEPTILLVLLGIATITIAFITLTILFKPQREIFLPLSVLIIMIVVSTVGLYYVHEDDDNENDSKSFLHSLYMAVSILTSIGHNILNNDDKSGWIVPAISILTPLFLATLAYFIYNIYHAIHEALLPRYSATLQAQNTAYKQKLQDRDRNLLEGIVINDDQLRRREQNNNHNNIKNKKIPLQEYDEQSVDYHSVMEQTMGRAWADDSNDDTTTHLDNDNNSSTISMRDVIIFVRQNLVSTYYYRPDKQLSLDEWRRRKLMKKLLKTTSTAKSSLVFYQAGARNPSFVLQVLVQERLAAIIARDVAGYEAPVDTRGVVTSINIDSFKSTLEKWHIPQQARHEFITVAFDILLSIGEQKLVKEGIEVLLDLHPVQFYKLFGPLLQAFGDAGTMEAWLAKTELLTSIDMGPTVWFERELLEEIIKTKGSFDLSNNGAAGTPQQSEDERSQ